MEFIAVQYIKFYIPGNKAFSFLKDNNKYTLFKRKIINLNLVSRWELSAAQLHIHLLLTKTNILVTQQPILIGVS